MIVSYFISDSFDGVDVTLNMQIFEGIMKGVQYIHSNGFMHRDLKASCRIIFVFLILSYEVAPLPVEINNKRTKSVFLQAPHHYLSANFIALPQC